MEEKLPIVPVGQIVVTEDFAAAVVENIVQFRGMFQLALSTAPPELDGRQIAPPI